MATKQEITSVIDSSFGLGGDYKENEAFDAINDELVHQVQFSLTAAQAIASTATPVTIVAAPGAGKILVPVAIQLSMDYGSVAFSAVNLTLIHTGGTLTYATIDGIEATADTEWLALCAASAATGTTTTMVNTGLQIKGSGSLGSGNSTFTGVILYRVIDAV